MAPVPGRLERARSSIRDNPIMQRNSGITPPSSPQLSRAAEGSAAAKAKKSATTDKGTATGKAAAEEVATEPVAAEKAASKAPTTQLSAVGDSALISTPCVLKVGGRVLAHAPEGGDGNQVRWVPGRVLSSRTHGGIVQYKVSLDGYDSENDEWLTADDERVQPYEASTDSKEAATREADEKLVARLQSEQRRHDGMREHREAVAAASVD